MNDTFDPVDPSGRYVKLVFLSVNCDPQPRQMLNGLPKGFCAVDRKTGVRQSAFNHRSVFLGKELTALHASAVVEIDRDFNPLSPPVGS